MTPQEMTWDLLVQEDRLLGVALSLRGRHFCEMMADAPGKAMPGLLDGLTFAADPDFVETRSETGAFVRLPMGDPGALPGDTPVEVLRILGEAFLTPRRPAVYVAGPDLFFPEWEPRRRDYLLMARRSGAYALLPGDLPGMSPREIYERDVLRVRLCRAVIANLTPFRGSEPDSGTCVEVGMALALGKPVLGWGPSWISPDAGGYRAAVERTVGLGAPREGATSDRDGCLVDDTGLAWNLMLGVPVPYFDSFERAVAALSAHVPD